MIKPLAFLLISGLLSGTNQVLVRNETVTVEVTTATEEAPAASTSEESSSIPPDDDTVKI
jgi:hypothetical protein